MGALEMFMSWQAVTLAVIVVTLSGGVKALVDTAWPGGKEARRGNRWVTRLVLPAMPLVLGFVAGVFVPLRPVAVVEFVITHADPDWHWLGYGGWGFVAGGVAGDYLYSKFKSFLRHSGHRA